MLTVFFFFVKKNRANLKVTAADMRYVARSKLSRSSLSLIWLVVRKFGYLFCSRGRVPLLTFNELEEKSQATIILGKFDSPNKKNITKFFFHVKSENIKILNVKNRLKFISWTRNKWQILDSFFWICRFSSKLSYHSYEQPTMRL